jgi:hypothetical protein
LFIVPATWQCVDHKNVVVAKSKHIIQKCMADMGTGITDVVGGPRDFLPPRSDEFQKLWYPKRTTDHGQETGKLYYLRLRVEYTLFVIYKARLTPTPYW